MNILYKLYCRTFQLYFRLVSPLMPYREPLLLNDMNDIISLLNNNGYKNILLVIDKGLRQFHVTKPLEDMLTHNNFNLTIYDKTMPNPTTYNVEEGLELYNKNNCEFIIGFGGGSSMDLAKAIGARAVYPNKSISQLKGLLRVLRKLPPLLAIPTTAGTGSEVTLTSVISDPDTKRKYPMNSFTLIPSYALLDASVTLSLPPHMTSTTGMDALTHAIEAYIGNSTTQETRTLAKEAVKLILENIETVYKDGNNKEARKNMLIASYKAGIAFSKSYVGYVHAVAHTLGGQYNTPHGLANAVLLPIVLKEYGECIYKKLYELAVHANIADVNENYESAANKLIHKIEQLNHDMNIPNTFDFIKKDDIEELAKHAASEANPLYPVPKLMSAKQLEVFYYKVSNWS